jgi:hypothetical protein
MRIRKMDKHDFFIANKEKTQTMKCNKKCLDYFFGGSVTESNKNPISSLALHLTA